MQFVISLPVYLTEIMVSVDQQEDELKDFLKEQGITTEKDHGKGSVAITTSFGSWKHLIRIQTKKLDRCFLTLESVIAHEAFHATTFIMKACGIGFCNKSDEAFAYLLGYIVGEIHKKIKESSQPATN
jgi:hypothetical protein